MPQMNRNVNLEEIDSDALFGIDALKHQTLLQKILFFGSLLLGVAVNVFLPMFLKTPRIACVAIFLVLLCVGVAFGCNYTEDMTYGKYLYFAFFKPKKYLLYESTEDVEEMKKKAEELRREEDRKLQSRRMADPKAQRKLLLKLAGFVLVIGIVLAGAVLFSKVKEKDSLHHTVEAGQVSTDESTEGAN